VTVPTDVGARSPLTFEGRLTLQEPRRIVPQLAGTRTDSLALAMLDDLFRRPRRRPLWACEVCGKVIPQPARGRLVRYCSNGCKVKGIPSASRRAQYVEEYRRRRREAELAKSRDALKGLPTNRQYEALRAALPGRPRKALLHLLRTIRREKQFQPTHT
jgi:hypothetical protein